MKNNTQQPYGQGAIEYILMMTIIILVLLAVLQPFGIVTKNINKSLDTAVKGVECMAEKTCYDGDPCPPKYSCP